MFTIIVVVGAVRVMACWSQTIGCPWTHQKMGLTREPSMEQSITNAAIRI
jgi:hypothetical protein